MAVDYITVEGKGRLVPRPDLTDDGFGAVYLGNSLDDSVGV